MDNPNVCAVLCSCGKARKLAVLKDGMVSEEGHKEILKLIKKGYETKTITLEQAREYDLCFDSCTEKKHIDDENS